MKNYNSEIIYYAKGWYEVTDVIEDMKKICGKNPEYVSVSDIITVLFHIIEEHHKNINFNFLIDFISDIDPNSMRQRMFNDGKYNFHKAVIEKSLSVISLMQVKDGDGVIIELDDIDSFESVLPRIKIN